MRKTILRRLEVLELEGHSREQKELSSLGGALVYIWKIVLAYYVGGLKSDEEEEDEEDEEEEEEEEEDDLSEAYARALKYPSHDDYLEAIFKCMRVRDLQYPSEDDYREATLNLSEIRKRYDEAVRRLFANVGLDLDSTPRNVLFDAVVTMVDQLPEEWLSWLRSNLRQYCPHAEIAAGSNLPRRLSGDNIFLFSNDKA
jgi:hypothetical protein